MTESRGDVEVKDEAPKLAEKLAQMRRRFEQLMAKEPGAIIIFADFGNDLEAVAIGSELDMHVLHREGTKLLAAMLLKTHAELEAPRPAKLDLN